jgi:hypothetical protein
LFQHYSGHRAICYGAGTCTIANCGIFQRIAYGKQLVTLEICGWEEDLSDITSSGAGCSESRYCPGAFLGKINGGRDQRNLLYPNPNWHGYQPFFFLASDLAENPENRIDPTTRREFNLPKLKIRLVTEIERVDVEPISPSASSSHKYQFNDLVLRITTGPLPK